MELLSTLWIWSTEAVLLAGALVKYTILPATLGAWLYARRMKAAPGISGQASPTRAEKWIIWLVCILSPLLAGAIMYYTLRRALPQKARYANHVSFIIFGAYLVAWALAVVEVWNLLSDPSQVGGP